MTRQLLVKTRIFNSFQWIAIDPKKGKVSDHAMKGAIVHNMRMALVESSTGVPLLLQMVWQMQPYLSSVVRGVPFAAFPCAEWIQNHCKKQFPSPPYGQSPPTVKLQPILVIQQLRIHYDGANPNTHTQGITKITSNKDTTHRTTRLSQFKIMLGVILGETDQALD